MCRALPWPAEAGPVAAAVLLTPGTAAAHPFSATAILLDVAADRVTGSLWKRPRLSDVTRHR